MSEIAAIAEASFEEVVQAVERFRLPGRSFLMPPVPVPLTPDSIVDLSHETLMRCWTRLRGWVEEERADAAVYLRLTRAAQWFDAGEAGLWRDPELGLGLKWRTERRPTAAWAERYDPSFERAIRFLENSEAERDRLVNERRAERRRQFRRLQWVAGALALLLFISAVTTYVARRESCARAPRAIEPSATCSWRAPLWMNRWWSSSASRRASAWTCPRSSGCRGVAAKAQRFYSDFILQGLKARVERDIAIRTSPAGHIDRALEAPRSSGESLPGGHRGVCGAGPAHPARAEYRGALADAYNWLGESLRRPADGTPKPRRLRQSPRTGRRSAGEVELPAQRQGWLACATTGRFSWQAGWPGRRHPRRGPRPTCARRSGCWNQLRHKPRQSPRKTSGGRTTTWAA